MNHDRETVTDAVTRICDGCQGHMHQRKNESNHNFANRRFCSCSCSNRVKATGKKKPHTRVGNFCPFCESIIAPECVIRDAERCLPARQRVIWMSCDNCGSITAGGKLVADPVDLANIRDIIAGRRE